MTAKEILKKDYLEEKQMQEEISGEDVYYNKYVWAAENIFDINTDDSTVDEYFCRNIIEICKIVLSVRNYEYMEKSKENYIRFLACVCWMDKMRWTGCGTSIRGTWFEPVKETDFDFMDEIPKVYLLGSEGCTNVVRFSKENLKQLIDFVEEPE